MSRIHVINISYNNLTVRHRGKLKYIKLEVLEDYLNMCEWHTQPRRGKDKVSHLEPSGVLK